MFLPKPVLSNDDIVVVQNGSRQSASMIWEAWSKDPIRAAVIRAVLACMNSGSRHSFSFAMAAALHQSWVCFVHFIGCRGRALLKRFQHYGCFETASSLEILEKYPNIWRSPVDDAQEENQ